jgi:2-iminobutanoate/2-iminopropanoate deaminase
MKRLVLAVVAIVCFGISVEAQTTSKRKAVNSGTPNGIFSSAIVVGNLVFTSGQIGFDAKTNQMAEGMEAQLEQVFRNLTAVLEASGSSIDHVVKATVFLADMNDYAKMNELYKAKFKGDPPARSTVQVARLPRDARIEIEVVAVLK